MWNKTTTTTNNYAAKTNNTAIADATVLAEVSTVETTAVNAATTEAEGIALQKKREDAAYERITKLRDERQHWQDTVYKTANDMLYDVLKKCYALYFDMCGKNTTAAALRVALARHIKQNNIQVGDKAHTINKIVHCVFNGSNKRISAYSRVLIAALEHKNGQITVDGLVQFITDAGGIEEVRRNSGKTGTTNADRAEQAKTALQGTVLAKVTDKAVVQKLDAAADGVMHVAIVTQRAGGEIEINAIVVSETVLKAALAAYYSSNKEQLTATAANNNTANTQAEQGKQLDELAALVA